MVTTPNRPERTRRDFILNYPMFRYWRKEAIADGTTPQPLNIYVHMPYCIQRCAYCYFKTTTLKENRLAQIDHYVDSVCKEIELATRRYHLDERPIRTVYFGGGTPTLMSEENLDKIFTTLRANLDLSHVEEINVEGEPVTLTERKARVLKKNGVNRISLGIQSFCEEIVFNTGRADTEEQALKAIALAASTGATVNIDLISGLAGDRMETWAYSVQRALESGAHSITLYKLELYANTPYYASEKKSEIALPTDEQELELARYAIAEFKKNGYLPVNTFTFTKGGAYDQVHTRSKWTGEDNYAFGVSAFGGLGRWGYQNTSDIPTYTETVARGELPYNRAYTATSLDLMIREMVLGVKLIHLDHVRFKKRHGVDLLKICASTLQELEEEGLLTVDAQHVSLTDEGLLYGDHVARVLEGAFKDFAGADSGGRARVHFADPQLIGIGGRENEATQ